MRDSVIDDSWSQAHSMALADINGDGTPDLITGKRFMAHNGSDPDESGKLGVYWYELQRGANPKWTKHVISFDQGDTGRNKRDRVGTVQNTPCEGRVIQQQFSMVDQSLCVGG